MGKRILFSIVASAFLGRAVLIWLTRPEYVGWFNHSYYYWVQTRTLLLEGSLAYADMPLIFYGYAALASVLQAFGMEMEPGIISATRFSMSLVPALIAIPVFLTLRRINNGDTLTAPFWLLVGISAFLPLTLAHMPELLQKNMLGLLLLFVLNYFVYLALHKQTRKVLAIVAVLLLAIALTHLGTLAVSVALGIGLAAAISYEFRTGKNTLKIVAALFALILAGAVLVAAADADAFARVLRYAQSSLPNSLLGRLLNGPGPAEGLLLLCGILAPAALAFGLFRIYCRHRESLALPDRIFWPSHILLAYLLMAPVIDLEVLPRLILFLPLPALMIVAYHLRYHRNRWLNRLTVAAATAGCVLMLVGDATGVLLQYPNKAETHAELDDMRARFALTSDDFVLTPYGGNTICNWFLGTRAGLITSFNRDDMQKYVRIFVLNPPDAQVLGDAELRMRDGMITFETERQKYEAMRLNVPVVGKLPNMINYQHLDLRRLDLIPDDWLFDDDRNWMGANYEAYLDP